MSVKSDLKYKAEPYNTQNKQFYLATSVVYDEIDRLNSSISGS